MARVKKDKENKQIYFRSGPSAIIEQTVLNFLVSINYMGSNTTTAAISVIFKKIYENMDFLEDDILYTDLNEKFRKYVIENEKRSEIEKDDNLGVDILADNSETLTSEAQNYENAEE